MAELLEDPAFRHVLLNHLPITGLVLSFVVLATGAALRQAAMLRLGLVLVALTAGSSLPVSMSGDDAYPAVFDLLGGDGRDWLDYHTHLAETWLPILYANGALSLVALGVGTVRRTLLLPASLLVLLLTLGGIAVGSLIAEAGGKIKHPEFRLEDPPRFESERRLR